MNFPTWPCNFPQKAEESNNDKFANDKLAKKLSKKISNLDKIVNDFETYLKTKNLNTLNQIKSPKGTLQKLAEGSFILKFDLDDSYSQDGNIPFPKEPF